MTNEDSAFHHKPMTVTISRFGENNRDADILCCPACGFLYLHQTGVVVYHRRNEDDQDMTVTHVGYGEAITHRTRETNNPSERRSGMAIQFACEGCENVFELTIEEHKGNTYLGWRGHPNGKATYKLYARDVERQGEASLVDE
jgi:hypothetical protein